HPVGEHQHDAAAVDVQQVGDADVHRVPQRRRALRLQLVAEDVDQLVVAAGEVARVDLDAVGKAADARPVGRLHGVDELLRGLLDQIEVRAHAAAAIQQHDDGDRLDLVGEDGEVHALAVVFDLELVAREIRNQPAGIVGDGGEHRHRPVAGGEGR